MRTLFACCVMLLVGGSARGEDPKAMFERATADYKAGNYAEAAAVYEEIYRITNNPVLLYNVGQAHRQAGNLEPALAAYRGYLEKSPDAKNAEAVNKRIAELELQIELTPKPVEKTPEPEAKPAPPPPVVEKAPPKKDEP